MARYRYITSGEKYAKCFPDKPHGYEGAGLYNVRTGYMMDQPQEDIICAPQIMRDIPEYKSPVTYETYYEHGVKKCRHAVISSRSHRREDLKRNNCVPFEPPKGKTLMERQNERKRKPIELTPERGLIERQRAVFRRELGAIGGIHK